MKNEDKPRLFPEHFKTGKYSGSPRTFEKGRITMPRGGEDWLEYWYSEDPEESEFLDEDFQEHIEAKIQHLKDNGWDPDKQIFWATTQSHLDLGWRWRFIQGVAKAERTFNKVHGHFDLFTPFTFTGSQPAMYQWVKLNSPEIWDKVKEDVESGRHELQGGCWSEADGRMPSGEAWVRQRLYGQHFYANNFGKIANVAWFPDSFGYANNLPQIFAKSGADGFLTAKLVSNKQTKWPFWAWIWEAPDGTQLLSYLTGNHNKLGPLGGFDVDQADSDVKESYVKSYKLLEPNTNLVADYDLNEPENHENVSNDEIPMIGCFFGEGDGGHGPQGVEMAVYRGYAERGYVKWKSTRQIYDKLRTFQDRLPVWKDELYYEFHRGSLTTQHLMKRMNRYFEWNLPVVEGMKIIAELISGTHLASFDEFYTRENDQIKMTENPIAQIWYNTLLMQFHDVLPGTSVPEVYDECYEFWHQDRPLLRSLRDAALDRLWTLLGPEAKNVNKLELNDSQVEIFGIPIMVANTSGASGPHVIEIDVSEFEDLFPVCMIARENIDERPRMDISEIQHVDGDTFGYELDRKPDRYVLATDMEQWSIMFNWILAVKKPGDKGKALKVLRQHEDVIDDMGLKTVITTEDVENKVVLEQKRGKETLSVKISKETGMIDQMILNGNQLLKKPAEIRCFEDKPYKNPCWNYPVNWWENPMDSLMEEPEIELIEQGPVKWTVRIKTNLRKNSSLFIDYTMTKNLPGLDVEMGIDFHETETLVKYMLPVNIATDYSVAETPYATSKRLNEPMANHDKPRWEKWMHTFVLFEDEKDKQSPGVAVLNEGKYGFDTVDGDLSISIVHGPEYPAPDVVSWVKGERKKRKKLGLGEPPTHADQGESLTRLRIMPYNGSWQNGKVHHAAHGFNVDCGVKTLKTTEKAARVASLSDMLSKTDIYTFLKSSNPQIEITVLKGGEHMPSCLGGISETPNSTSSAVFRAVNNSSQETDTTITIDGSLLDGKSRVVEADLLERPIEDSLSVKFIGDENDVKLALRFKPHEIRTFKIR